MLGSYDKWKTASPYDRAPRPAEETRWYRCDVCAEDYSISEEWDEEDHCWREVADEVAEVTGRDTCLCSHCAVLDEEGRDDVRAWVAEQAGGEG